MRMEWMIVADGAQHGAQLESNEYNKKLNYIHWLTYYTNIRINFVFLVLTIMFDWESVRVCVLERCALPSFSILSS